MKRGFLNTDKARKAAEQAHAPPPEPDPPSPDLSALSKDNGKARAVHQDADVDPQPLSSATGTPNPEAEQALDDLGRMEMPYYPRSSPYYHRLPPVVQKMYGTKKRVTFREWPRDPKGKPILPLAEFKGRTTPNKLSWGATLFDFFTVRRIPGLNAITTMTGSKLLQVMENIGELGYAKAEVEWAATEQDPKVVRVADTQELIERYDLRVKLGIFDSYSMIDSVRESALKMSEYQVHNEHGEGDEDMEKEDEDKEKRKGKEGPTEGLAPHAEEDRTDDVSDSMDVDSQWSSMHSDEEMLEEDESVIPIPPPPEITSPFHPSHYPPPWPFIPFTVPGVPMPLQERIPFHLLPRTLYVHDPFNVLSVRRRKIIDTSWLSRPDIIRTYTLSSSPAVQEEIEKAIKDAEEMEEFKARTLIILRYTRTKQQIENHEPIIEVPLPPYQRRLTKVEESHLYISPVAKVGEGNHSVVYKAEWELPRDLLTTPDLCRTCMKESMKEEIQNLRKSGRWNRMMRAACWGPKGLTGDSTTQTEIDAMEDVNDLPILEKDGEIIEREITCIVSPDTHPIKILREMEEGKVWELFKKKNQNSPANAANQVIITFAQEEEVPLPKGSTSISAAPRVRINPKLAYQNPYNALCPHRTVTNVCPVPRTTRFTVAAKLSIQHDTHLAREAENYQSFPEHFFQYWSGYNFVPPIRDPVPVHALVPQFFGYYTPVLEHENKEASMDEEKEESDQKPNLSPILLLEHCGNPINPDTFSMDDQEECRSLLLRFHAAGWLHESVAARNILVQECSPTEFPTTWLTTETERSPSFRLIDFGRSRKYNKSEERMLEETAALRLFRLSY
ncbi:hypothetical protein PAXRUDRAFT_725815 [Paxillus rubicundulus Ve08.2h10]|uniref:Protein kinase domain-containing protein n=1 Tax=Paxillus rubicundulus Ve08.2h10 TaxID=930991 RepID=A0A0D0DRB3_9AGAM|nr:hypothetical protein PAXRUDRAFT_725815 [Paxillus rubicundulus Ve08.2h10]